MDAGEADAVPSEELVSDLKCARRESNPHAREGTGT